MIFKNCSLVGSSLVNTPLRSVLFENCNLEYSNFSTIFKEVDFISCNLKHGRFYENDVKAIDFDTCDLSNCEIFKTKLSGVDLSNSKIEDISSDFMSIKGTTVDLSGIIELSHVIGVNIKF